MKLAPILVLALAACTSAPLPVSRPAAEPVHIVIVGTTDVHGYFNGRVEAGRSGVEGVHAGGLALFSSYVNVLREQNGGRVVLVDGGDMFQGTLESNLFEGEAVVRGYNAIGYSAAAVGNHEFDFGPVGPLPVPRNADDDPLGALKRNARIAQFPFLSANMIDRTTGVTPGWARRYTIVSIGGVRIGIIGLSTPDTPAVTMEANVRSLAFGDPVTATVKAAAELRERGVDAVIVVAHMGGRCTDVHDPHDTSSCESEQEANQLLAALPPGTIDAYFGGHTHQQMRQFIHGVPAVQALAYSRDFATLDLWIDPAAKKVVRERTEIRPHTMICSVVYAGTESCDPRNAVQGAVLVPRSFGGKTIVPDPKLTALFTPYLQRVSAKRHEKIGVRTTAPFTRAYLRESPLGDLLADAMREAGGAEIGIMNAGGIRAELRTGELVYGDMFEVSPFDNYLAVVQMTGAQIDQFIRLTSNGERGIMQVSGLKYTFDESKDADKPFAQRDRVVSLTLADGTPLEPERVYKVAMPDFIAAGGDNSAAVTKKIPADRIQVDLTRPLREVFVDVLRKHPQPLAPKTEGRITVVGAKR